MRIGIVKLHKLRFLAAANKWHDFFEQHTGPVVILVFIILDRSIILELPIRTFLDFSEITAGYGKH
jgi:hypothetical protein